MTNKIFRKVLDISYDLKDVSSTKNRHFSFLIRRNKILSVGWNRSRETHPLSFKYGYRFNSIHSELDAIIRCRLSDFSKITLINVRINRFGEIGYSKPCKICLKMIGDFGIKQTYYSMLNSKNFLLL